MRYEAAIMTAAELAATTGVLAQDGTPEAAPSRAVLTTGANGQVAAPAPVTVPATPAVPAVPVAPASLSTIPSPSAILTPGAGNADAARTEAPVTRRMVVRGSLFNQAPQGPAAEPGDAQPPAAASYIAVSAAQPKKFKKHDIVTVIVREDSTSSSTGKTDSEKKQDFDLALQQMAQLNLSQSGLPTVNAVGNPSQLPEVKFKYDNNRQNNASNERQDSFAARISAEVIDIKPNGTLVLEATKNVTVDKEEQSFKLSGICRAEDIQSDNSVLSTQIAQLKVEKQTSGEVRDGTRAGWLNKFIDKVNPF